MVYVWVVETLQYVGSKLLKLFHRQVQSLHKLVELYLVDVLADNLVVASIANDVDTAEECNWRQYCVRTIEQCNLALVVWFLALCDENVQTSLFCREFCAKLLACHVLSLFDNPEVEDFCLYNEVVLVRNLLLNLSNLLAWESRNDTVYQCSANIAIVCKPALESFVVSTEILFPKFDILIDALLEVVTVQEDKLARHDDKTLLRITIKELVAVEQ